MKFNIINNGTQKLMFENTAFSLKSIIENVKAQIWNTTLLQYILYHDDFRSLNFILSLLVKGFIIIFSFKFKYPIIPYLKLK